MDGYQPQLEGSYEDIDDALTDLVNAAGGFKRVGGLLWPSLPAEDAAQRLRHALNKSRREKLSQHEIMALLRKGREIGFHNAKHFVDDAAGYSRAAPLDPKDELAVLQRLYIDSVQQQKAIADRLERLTRSPLSVVAEKKSTA